ncbi:LOW QUALITY PROTEIN: SERTA domain-containing protein 3 [Menidia menidia]
MVKMNGQIHPKGILRPRSVSCPRWTASLRPPPPPLAPPPPAHGAGVWESQHQFLFSVSLHKYERSRALAEPSLRRCVLLANTLRQASLEAAAPPPPGPPAAVAMATEEEEDWGAADPSDFSLSAAISSILTALDVALDAPPPPSPRAPLRSVENLPGEGGRPGGGASAEDLVQDIDMALLERDGGALGLRGAVATAAAGGDELLRFLPPLCPPPLKCLPSFSSFSPRASSSSSSSSSAQSQGRDGFDLDHLMEILVES